VEGKTAIIVGAGIAGLAAALRLHQIGWKPIIFERAPRLRDGGFPLVLAESGCAAADHMGVLPSIRERNLGLTDLSYYKSNGRRQLTFPGTQALGRRLRVRRDDLGAALFDSITDKVDVRFGATITSIAQDQKEVVVRTTDNSAYRADLLVGADGVRSTVRRLVFGGDENFNLDLNRMVAAFHLNHVPIGMNENEQSVVIAPGRVLTVSMVAPGEWVAFFTYRTKDPAAELTKGPGRSLRDAYAGIHWAVPSLFANLDDDRVYFDSTNQIVMERWRHGRVVLLGDAAWCPTVFAGRGASLALEGADQLGTCIEHHPDDFESSLAVWEAGLRPRVSAAQQMARLNTAVHDRSQLRLDIDLLRFRFRAHPAVTRILNRAYERWRR
jgi:2-polyprenyl-6-methoxyphenol hydroxylase-like FAD-dependent oxidoreductase